MTVQNTVLSATRPAPPPLAPAARAKSDRQFNLLLLILATGAVAAAAGLQLQPDHQHLKIAFTSITLPPSCMLHSAFGIACPGCGLTRSFACLAHGQLSDAFHMNRMGVLIAALVAVQIPYRIARLAKPSWSIRVPWAQKLLIVLGVALVVNWILALTVWPQEDQRPTGSAQPIAQSGR